MKIKTLLSALLIGCLVTLTSHVTFALDTGPDKVPKKECASVDVVNFDDVNFVNVSSYYFDVEIETIPYAYAKDVNSTDNSLEMPLVDLPEKVGWYRTMILSIYNIPTTTTINKNSTTATNLNKDFLWIDRIKQCIFRSECSPTTV